MRTCGEQSRESGASLLTVFLLCIPIVFVSVASFVHLNGLVYAHSLASDAAVTVARAAAANTTESVDPGTGEVYLSVDCDQARDAAGQYWAGLRGSIIASSGLPLLTPRSEATFSVETRCTRTGVQVRISDTYRGGALTRNTGWFMDFTVVGEATVTQLAR